MPILTVDFQVSNIPAVEYPQIGDEMSNGAIITTDNRKEYFKSFERTEGDMTVSNLDVGFILLDANEDGTGTLSITKRFDEVTEQEALKWMNELSTFVLSDLISGNMIEVDVLKVKEYVYM